MTEETHPMFANAITTLVSTQNDQSLQLYDQQLVNEYRTQLIQEGLDQKFSDMFAQSFAAFLLFDQKTDYVVDLDDVWEGLGYSNLIKIQMSWILSRNLIYPEMGK